MLPSDLVFMGRALILVQIIIHVIVKLGIMENIVIWMLTTVLARKKVFVEAMKIIIHFPSCISIK